MAALFYYAEPRAVAASLGDAKPFWLLASVALVAIDRGVGAYRWLLLLRAAGPGHRIAFRSLLRVFFVSGFFGTFLPGSVGGDALRGYSLSRLDVPAVEAYASVFVDRLLGVASVVVMAAGGLVVARHLFTESTMTLLWLSVVAALGVSFLLLFDARVLSGIVEWLTARRFPAVHRLLDKALGAVRQYGAHRRTLLAVFALSVGVQALRTLEAWALGRALAIDLGVIWYFAFVPVIVLVMLLPTSVAGLGTGALAFQLLFGAIGVPAAETFALAVLFTALGFVGNLPGGVWFALDQRGRDQGATKSQ
jgi:uncharacterized protein (TIRG00374 family)